MYRHCIYCSADLKSNDAIEGFPVGRTIAFDAAQGRLWAVCGKCARWNLAPLEERWEPIEQAEKAFRDTRLRVQRENIGVAGLADGTRLVRVGGALQGELAAWRYGGEMRRRSHRYLMATGAAILGGAAIYSGLVGIPLGSALFYGLGYQKLLEMVMSGRPVQVLEPARRRRPTSFIRRRDLNRASLRLGDGGLRLVLPEYYPPGSSSPSELVVQGTAARGLLRRAMLLSNRSGASEAEVATAVSFVGDSGGAEQLIVKTAAKGANLGIDQWHWLLDYGRQAERRKAAGPQVPREELLALEMALHEHDERRALEGELAVLESAWREAEEIAGIADRLAMGPGEG